MAQNDIKPPESTPDVTEVEPDTSWRSRASFYVWLLVSVGFLAYLAFGSVEARIWSFGRLFFQNRKIVHVWAYFGHRLPDLPGAPLTATLYYVSLAVMVMGTVLGLWYMLVDDGDSKTAARASSAPLPSAHPRHHA